MFPHINMVLICFVTELSLTGLCEQTTQVTYKNEIVCVVKALLALELEGSEKHSWRPF